MKKQKYMQLKPTPPDDLNSKSLAVWASWSTIGVKEVARECVMKGTHIDLAKLYLSKKLEIDDIEIWFKNEIHSWILDLLLRKQIYRALHILDNMGSNPLEEMYTIFLDTSCKELRQNVGNHLTKHEKLSKSDINNWHLLDAIEKQPDILNSLKEKCVHVNLNCIMAESEDWRNETGTKVFFKTFDFTVKEFIQPKVAWIHLINTNTDLLMYWIKLYYNKNTVSHVILPDIQLDAETLIKLNSILLNLDIDDEMISLLESPEYSIDLVIKREIFGELCKFGIFSIADKNNLIDIIKRLLEANKIGDIKEILTESQSNINLQHFFDLLINYCEANNFGNIVNTCGRDFMKIREIESDSDCINIIKSNYRMCRNLNNMELLKNNIFDLAKFLSKNNLVTYFNSYPLVLLSIVLFTKDISILDLLSNRVSIPIKVFEINKEVLLDAMKDYYYFTHISKRFSNTDNKNGVNYYELLQKHGNINVDSVYDFRKYDHPALLPNFNSPVLIEKHGYTKQLDFTYYLKNSRPMHAYKIFKTKYLDMGINEFDYMFYIDKVYRITLNNFKSPQITSSCVGFLEILGENSFPLRIYLRAANIIFNSEKISENDVIRLFSSVPMNISDIFSLLEASTLENVHLDSDSPGEILIEALKSQSVIIKFSTLHQLKLPELFLKYCAQKDLWLPFLIHVQIYNYPIDLICKIMQNFKSKSLIEHLGHAVTHDIPVDELRSQLMGERDSRKYFLSKLGVRITDSSGGSSDLSSHSSYGSMGNSIGSDFLESETLDYKTDLLEVLIKCHNSVDPPKALLHASKYYKSPLLAVLANSYEPDSVIINWAVWLEVSCDIEESFINFEGVLSADSVLTLFNDIIRNKYLKTLTNSFHIFLEDNVLTIFLKFLNEMVKFNFDSDINETLALFKKKLKLWRSNSFVTDIDNYMTYFNSKNWIQNAAVFLLFSTLQHSFRCEYDQILVLRYLNKINISQFFTITLPDIKTLLEIYEFLYEQNTKISIDLSLLWEKNRFIPTITSYINEMVDGDLYHVALELAQLIKIPYDFLIIRQMKNLFENLTKRNEEFWKKWDKILKDHKITPNTIINIYLDFLHRITDKLEEFWILKLAYNCIRINKLDNYLHIEKDMWTLYLQLDNPNKNLDVIFNENLMHYPDYLKELYNIPGCYNTLNEKEIENFDKTIEYLLNNEHICDALRLEKLFGYSNTDLDILKLCLMLVEDLILPHQLTAKQRLLLNRRNNIKGSARIRRKTYMTPRISSCHSAGSLLGTSIPTNLKDNVVVPIHDTLALLEMLVDNLKTGTFFASKIYKTYRISVNLQCKYDTTVSCREPFIMLKEGLRKNCRNKLDVVSDFIDIFKLGKHEIAYLLFTELLAAINYYSISKMNIYTLWDINVDTDFHLILQLLPDNCSLLGFKLYYACSNEFATNDLICLTELFIRSHDCFTADCNMEGISMILKKCKTFTSTLEGLRDYNLIVRLLTGIGRYAEMTYIFHILRQEEQFELLLRKGSRRDNALKIALLEYLKKYCPDNVELYKIVALHFFLFSEIAELWEQEALRLSQRIIALAKLEMQNYRLNPDTEPYVVYLNTEDNKKALRKIMYKYSHAAEYHLHGQKLKKAMAAANQSQLVALQLSLFKDVNLNGKVMCILNLNNVQLNKLILSDFSYQQISIVIEAYNFNADWANILFEQYLIQNRIDYLKGYALTFSITEILIHEISRLFLNSTNITDVMSTNMKTLLRKLHSIHAKYRIASELGFADVIEELLDHHELAYLKDTVWKSGYRNTDS